MSEQPLRNEARIGIRAEKNAYNIASAGSTTIIVFIRNQGLNDDTFALAVVGVPTAWIAEPLPVVKLSPGEEQKVEITLQAPELAENAHGEVPVTIRATSQEYREQASDVKVGLIIGAPAPLPKFSTELTPTLVEAGKNAEFKIVNSGIQKDTFKINWKNPEDALAFELWQRQGETGVFEESQMHVLPVEPGEAGSIFFRAGLRDRPFMGGSKTVPFQITVESSRGDTATEEGKVKDRAVIPLWVLPVILIICAGVFLFSLFFLNQGQNETNAAASQTAAVGTEIALRAEQTVVALETHRAQLTAGFPTDTPEPTSTVTPTNIPTNTPIPSSTPVPTNTPIPSDTPTEAPTEEIVETPTEAPTEHPGAELFDKTWVLEAFRATLEDQSLTPVVEGTTVDLIFEDPNIFNGNSGCNTYGGNFTTDGVQIDFQNINSSQLFCEEPVGVMEQEARYLGWLELTEEYRITGNGQLELILYTFENNQRVEKVLLVFNGLSIEPS